MMKALLAVTLITGLAVSCSAGQFDSRVERAKDKVCIKGVEGLAWGRGMDCTYIGTLTALAHYLGDDVSYDYLMGASGTAFRVQKWVKGWCPSAGCVGPGYSTVGTALDVLGYKMDWYGWYEGKPAAEARAAMGKPIMKSIDRGIPVMYLNMDDGLITGYADEGNKLVCRTYFDKDGEYSTLKDWPWCISVFKEKFKPKPRKEAVLASLKMATDMAGKSQSGDYYVGWTAYEKWIEGLLDEASFANEKDLNGIIHANAFCYSMLQDARTSAYRYLESIRNELGEESKPHLVKAASLYKQVAGKLKMGNKNVPFSWDLKDGKTWTQEQRAAEAKVLRDVMALEKLAVGEINEAAVAAAR